MARTIIRSYENHDRAASVVRELEAAGLPAKDISLVTRSMAAIEEGAHEGAEAGTVIGSGAGLLGALMSLPLPGVGSVLAAGWLIGGTAVGAVAGAAAGSLMGALTGAGVDERDAHVFAETIKRGGAVVAVRVPDHQVATAPAIMAGGQPVDPAVMRSRYEAEGWTGFDEKADARRDDLSGVVS